MGDLREALREYDELKRELRDEFRRRDLLVLADTGLPVVKMNNAITGGMPTELTSGQPPELGWRFEGARVDEESSQC